MVFLSCNTRVLFLLQFYKPNNQNICMKSQNKYRKFQLQNKNIEALEKENSRFRRVYSEYENLSNDLWELENSKTQSVPDDFINAIILQTNYLEEEIENWLVQFNQNKTDINS